MLQLCCNYTAEQHVRSTGVTISVLYDGDFFLNDVIKNLFYLFIILNFVPPFLLLAFTFSLHKQNY